MKTFLSLFISIGLAIQLGAISSVLAEATTEEADISISDFEDKTYGAWKTSGNAFGPAPAQGTLPNQMNVEGFHGHGLVNTYYNGDASTGTLTSPEFKIERSYITFLIGGGKDLQKTCLQLLIDGKPVRTATGPNDKPGGSERLDQSFWDVQEFIGQTATIQIIDQATGGWGHINVDNLIQTNHKPPLLLKNVKRSFTAEKRLLNIPIQNGAPKRIVTLFVDGEKIVANEIELADHTANWFAPLDISQWKGKQITLQVNQLMEDSTALSSIEQADTPKDIDSLYQEPLRGQFHFSPQHGWNNDPNGMTYYKGEYHLFFQHNPYGWNWGNMH